MGVGVEVQIFTAAVILTVLTRSLFTVIDRLAEVFHGRLPCVYVGGCGAISVPRQEVVAVSTEAMVEVE